MSMPIEEAIKILDSETTADAVKDIEYYAGFNHEKVLEKINEACEVAVEALKKQIAQPANDEVGDRYHWTSGRCPVCNTAIAARWDYCQNCGQKVKWPKNQYMKYAKKYNSTGTKRMKTQLHSDDHSIWSYISRGKSNPCGCGSKVYHYEYDGNTIFGVCNACNKKIYEIPHEENEERLKEGVWE